MRNKLENAVSAQTISLDRQILLASGVGAKVVNPAPYDAAH
jgi:hypothetical protein